MRGSTTLLGKSIKHFEPVIQAIVSVDPAASTLDVDRYADVGALPVLLGVGDSLRESLSGTATDTLVTKIMMGVFGSVPAFDTQFGRGFGAWTFSSRALQEIQAFYERKSAIIDAVDIATKDFSTGQDTDWCYTKAKIIDMAFFVAGA